MTFSLHANEDSLLYGNKVGRTDIYISFFALHNDNPKNVLVSFIFLDLKNAKIKCQLVTSKFSGKLRIDPWKIKKACTYFIKMATSTPKDRHCTAGKAGQIPVHSG